ncbi:hypothetical protein [Acinetobacter higginsii]|uniref:hypothetical protein n=1 Tax=Acinetobacter higginsii TaxID=70347 RepID=UPI00267551B1|nr:hypothetical protein [Acinetobacter higginsii]MDO3664897.1 hypothetical protein [Acinetobacter higginsii]
MLNSTKSFFIINSSLVYTNFIKDISVKMDKSWFIKSNYHIFFNNFDADKSLFFYHKRVKFVDYSDYEDAVLKDSIRNKIKHLYLSQPALINENVDENLILDLGDCILSKRIEINLSFSSKKIVKFHSDLVFLKNVPSVGARHGVDLFYYKKFFYNFNPISREFNLYNFFTKTKFRENIFFISIRPEVYMWRYNNSYCYYDVFYDIGHVIGCFSFLEFFLNEKQVTHFYFCEFNSDFFIDGVLPILFFEASYD